MTVIATGGYTHQPWLREVPGIDAVEPDLTLRGIRYAWEAHARPRAAGAAPRGARKSMTEGLGPLAGRRIVVGVSGSIAAYKAVALVRLLARARRGRRRGHDRRPPRRFVGRLTFESLTHRPVLDDVFELDADQQIAHIELAEAADAIVLAPATANLLGELAAGLVGRRGHRHRLRQPRAGDRGAGHGRRDVDASGDAAQRRAPCASSATSSSSRRSASWPPG